MSFLDSLTEIAGKAVNSLQAKQEQIDKYRSQMVRMSDRDIIRGYKNSSGTRRTAFMIEAKERGLTK